jgi:cytochrome c-type biogenesis protein CcmH/NrfG
VDQAYQASPGAAPLVGLAQVAIARGLDAEARELAGEAVAADPENQQAMRLLGAPAQKG